jgi:TonB family protein
MSNSLLIQKKTVTIGLILIIILVASVTIGQDITPPACFGGPRLLREFIKEEMVYPDRALQSKTEGIVILLFLVLSDGSTGDIRVVGSVSEEIDNEAIRIFSKILWYPATQIGIPIDYLHSMEIRFDIEKYLKHCKTRGYESFSYPHLPIDSSNKIYNRTKLDHWPKAIFNSFDRDFNTFITNNLTYPEAAFKQNISGRVTLEFVVETSGRVSNIVVKDAVGGGCTEEAIRVLKLLKWYPGLINDLAVRTFMELQLTFNIAGKSVGGSIPSPGQVQ